MTWLAISCPNYENVIWLPLDFSHLNSTTIDTLELMFYICRNKSRIFYGFWTFSSLYECYICIKNIRENTPTIVKCGKKAMNGYRIFRISNCFGDFSPLGEIHHTSARKTLLLFWGIEQELQKNTMKLFESKKWL